MQDQASPLPAPRVPHISILSADAKDSTREIVYLIVTSKHHHFSPSMGMLFLSNGFGHIYNQLRCLGNYWYFVRVPT